MGALNIHADHPHAFTKADIATAGTFATQAAMSLHADTRQQQFNAALASRDVIGQAKGMLMERYHIDATAAFSLLARLSQDSNTKLVDIALQIVHAGPGA